MVQVILPEIGTWETWRTKARGLLLAAIPPEEVFWSFGTAAPTLFAEEEYESGSGGAFAVPKSFLTLAKTVVWHADPERFAQLYTLLWRLRQTPGLMADRGDTALARLWTMEKSVRRDMHKMRAFLRFREVDHGVRDRRRFSAWFEPSHHILEPNAAFFARRFGDMDWLIATPTLSARFENGEISFEPGQAKPGLPDDSTEELWTTYYKNIFNPARLKVKAMTAEMPKKYWKNLPEAAAIPELVARAQERVTEMQETAPTKPPMRADRILSCLPKRNAPVTGTPDTLRQLALALKDCQRCPLHCAATQAVPGEGPSNADVMIVGEQPGDREDLEGRPFVGPAGQLFDRIAREAGLDRNNAYVTNAVKHFKFRPRGRRRIHQHPNTSEVQSCKWWLDLERALVRPKLILALGGIAAGAVTGDATNVMARRGQFEVAADGTPVLVTVHPSYLLRLPDAAARKDGEGNFRADLEKATAFLRQTYI